MSVRYFRKLGPSTKPLLSNGSAIEFATNDGVVGFFATDSDYVAGEFLRFMDQQKYGISEISAEAFQVEYLQKKTNSTQSIEPWREEIKGGRLQSSKDPLGRGGEGVPAVLAVEGKTDVPASKTQVSMAEAASTAISPPPEGSQPDQKFEPKVGKRVPRKKLP